MWELQCQTSQWFCGAWAFWIHCLFALREKQGRLCHLQSSDNEKSVWKRVFVHGMSVCTIPLQRHLAVVSSQAELFISLMNYSTYPCLLGNGTRAGAVSRALAFRQVIVELSNLQWSWLRRLAPYTKAIDINLGISTQSTRRLSEHPLYTDTHLPLGLHKPHLLQNWRRVLYISELQKRHLNEFNQSFLTCLPIQTSEHFSKWDV